MKLVIAEKPSVAMSLAAVLGATERKDGYLEGSGYLVSWCVGHLLELAQPEAYKEQYAKWRYEDLPILPENWKYEVPKDKKTQLALLCRLMKDKRVDSVVCATDAGREGELFLLVLRHLIFPFVRQDRQIAIAPSGILFPVGFRLCQLQKVADAPAHQVAAAFQIAVLFLICAQYRRQSHSDRGLFCNH